MIKYILLSIYIIFVIGLFGSLFKYPFVRRKTIHISLFGLWILLISFVWPVWLVITIAVCGGIAAILGYILLNHRIDILVYSGYLLVGVLFYLLKPEYINCFTVGLAILCLADGFAALVGRIAPDNTISSYNTKTIQGSITMFLITAFVLLVMQFNLIAILIGALIITITEYLATDYDNLVIILCATILYLICF